jgi:repressor LexA
MSRKRIRDMPSDTSNPESVLAYIREYIRTVGVPPSVRDICQDLRISSTSMAKYYLDRLQRDGKIVRIPGIARGIRVMEDSDGSAAADEPGERGANAGAESD